MNGADSLRFAVRPAFRKVRSLAALMSFGTKILHAVSRVGTAHRVYYCQKMPSIWMWEEMEVGSSFATVDKAP